MPIESVVAVSEPVKKRCSTVVGVMLGNNSHAFAIENIGYALFAIRSLEFEPVSGTHELNAHLL